MGHTHKYSRVTPLTYKFLVEHPHKVWYLEDIAKALGWDEGATSSISGALSGMIKGERGPKDADGNRLSDNPYKGITRVAKGAYRYDPPGSEIPGPVPLVVGSPAIRSQPTKAGPEDPSNWWPRRTDGKTDSEHEYVMLKIIHEKQDFFIGLDEDSDTVWRCTKLD